VYRNVKPPTSFQTQSYIKTPARLIAPNTVKLHMSPTTFTSPLVQSLQPILREEDEDDDDDDDEDLSIVPLRLSFPPLELLASPRLHVSLFVWDITCTLPLAWGDGETSWTTREDVVKETSKNSVAVRNFIFVDAVQREGWDSDSGRFWWSMARRMRSEEVEREQNSAQECVAGCSARAKCRKWIPEETSAAYKEL